ncbi:mechanosensitive ion channel family protein [Parapedobacter tibetensis]|uniref:mechanosensitive ion channel family protein n=1 Tax=Parapedobacter tibetensis TaxID=2972951 RepID=UPI00214D6EE4|nr:mechanosensitive ion channel domain-containing protein [Parapedobacter tibetensis]
MEILDKIQQIFQFTLVKTEDINFTVGALLTLVASFIITAFLLRIIRKAITKKISLQDRGKFISIFQFIQYLVYLFVTMFTLNAIGVNISVLLTASAAIFLGLGFALQQLFQDLISGVLIILDQSLRVGDIIEIEGYVCKVEKVSLRSTKAITPDERMVIIPNHKFMSDIIFNWTQNNQIVRSTVSVGVAYGSDVELVKKILLDSVHENPAILKQPEPFVLFEDFGDSSLDFKVYFYIDNGFREPRVRSAIRFDIDKQFRQHNVSIPFPQRDVHLFQQNKELGGN